jgi:uncharacterized protein (TIGR02217 family)
MSFDDVQLDEGIERGARGGPSFYTSIVGLSSGYEQRVGNWTYARQQWDIGYGIQNDVAFDAIRDFFYERRGRLRGFRFHDWSDDAAVAEAIGTGDTVETDFQLIKTYGSTNAYTRPITRPVSGTVTFYENAIASSPQPSHVGKGLYRYAGGNEPAAVPITADFEFDLPARFDTDDFGLVLQLYNAGAIPNLPIVELREVPQT